MKGKTCCVTGHRDLPQNEINKIKTALAHEIDAAVTRPVFCGAGAGKKADHPGTGADRSDPLPQASGQPK